MKTGFRESEFYKKNIYDNLKRIKTKLYLTLSHPIIILTYHRVKNADRDPQSLCVGIDNFRRQMEYLKENMKLVSLSESWSDLNDRAVAITFDDGYYDNYENVLPIIEDLGIPVTFFICSGFIGTSKLFWWDELEILTLSNAEYPEKFVLEDKNIWKKWPSKNIHERKLLYNDLHNMMRIIDKAKRECWMTQLRDWAKTIEITWPNSRAMSLAELRDLAKSRWVDIGAHTVNHVRLSSLSQAQQDEEIKDSKRQLELWLEKKINLFSYPYGQHNDFNSTSVNIVKDAKFIKSTANYSGLVNKFSNLYTLPRQTVRDWPIQIFKEKINNFLL